MKSTVWRDASSDTGNAAAGFRNLAVAVVIVAISAACARQSDSAQGRSAQEIERLAAITDHTIRTLQRLTAGESAPSGISATIKPLILSVRAARQQSNAHATEIRVDTPTRTSTDNRLDGRAYRAVAACARAGVIEVQDIERHIARFYEVRAKENDEAVEARRLTLFDAAYNATQCALLATESLRGASGLNAVEHIGMHVGEVFAIATAFQGISGHDMEPLLKRHIAANETIVARLAPECEKRRLLASDAPGAIVPHPCVSYRLARGALPKLKATLSRLTAQHRPPSTPVAKATDEIGSLTQITDSTVRLLKVLPAGEPSPEAHAAVRQIATAISAAGDALLRQAAEVRLDDPVDALLVYAKTKACVDAWVVMFPSVPTFLQRIEEAIATGDEETVKVRREILGLPAMDVIDCYFQSIAHFEVLRDREALNSLGLVVGEMYAIMTALDTMAGFRKGTQAALRRHIEANEAIVSRLAQACGKRQLSTTDAQTITAQHPCASHQVATDALPKLRSALAHLEQHAGGEPPLNPCSGAEEPMKRLCEDAYSRLPEKLKP